MTEARVFLNGELRASQDARLACDDAGFLVGDGLFETLRVNRRRPLDPEAHLDRLFDGLVRIRLTIPEVREALGAAIDAVARTAAEPVARLRVTVTRGGPASGPTRLVAAVPYAPPTLEAYDQGVAVAVIRELSVDHRDPLRQIKSTSWQRQSMALTRANELGAFEGILLNHRGAVAEGTRSNVIARLGDRVVTPPISDGCLPGTVRRRLLESGLVVEARLLESDLLGADELVVVNSLIGALPVCAVGSQHRAVGQCAARLRDALSAFGWSAAA